MRASKCGIAIALVVLNALPVGRALNALPAGRAQSEPEPPPRSYVCPMIEDADVLEDAPGKCPKCGMELTPIRLDSRWSCPVHTAMIQDTPGTCPIDKRDLVQVTVSVSWTCPADASVRELEPGVCADGKARVARYERRAHGDHNPRHGGQFFMASDNWHHLEGTYPRPGLFRIFLYDDYTKPLAAGAITGRAVTREELDPASKTWKELERFDLKPSADGQSLEAEVGNATLPARITAKLKFDANAQEQRFDFSFPAHTREPDAGAVMSVSPIATLAAAVAASAASFSVESLPGRVPDLLTALNLRDEQVRGLLDGGVISLVYVPAFEAKEIALVLETHAGELPEVRRKLVEPAVRRLVLAAWKLDRFADLGDRQKMTDMHVEFAAALADINAVYAPSR